MARAANHRLVELPSTFRYTDARRRSVSDRALRELHSSGQIEQIARGVYRRSDAEPADDDLLEIASKQPAATLCLGTALSAHDLSDELPAAIDIAVPRDTWRSSTVAPIRWHSFARETFELGRGQLELDESTSIGIYSAERSIIDAFRLRHLEGREQAYEALRRWLRRGGQAATLLDLARAFPRAMPAIRHALEVLLDRTDEGHA
jgi:predicted transcriptional regulator of viral defense system